MLLHSDGFDSHATGSATLSAGDPNWAAQSGVTIQAADGRFGGKSLRLPSGTAGYADFVVVGTYLAFAGWFNVRGLASAATLLSDSTGPLVQVQTGGSVVVKDGAGTTRATAAAGTIVAGTYAWVEVSYRNGSIVLNKAGLPVASYTGSYTAPNYSDLTLLGNSSRASAIDVDDFIVWDDQGSYFNTFGLRPRRIQLVNPTADGPTTDWTPLGASNWGSVSANSWAGADGVEATLSGQTDLYDFGDLPVAPGAVDAVTVKVRGVNNGSDPATLALLSGNGSVTSTGAAQTLPTSDATLRETFYRDPNGAAWSKSTVGSNYFGMRLGL